MRLLKEQVNKKTLSDKKQKTTKQTTWSIVKTWNSLQESRKAQRIPSAVKNTALCNRLIIYIYICTYTHSIDHPKATGLVPWHVLYTSMHENTTLPKEPKSYNRLGREKGPFCLWRDWHGGYLKDIAAVLLLLTLCTFLYNRIPDFQLGTWLSRKESPISHAAQWLHVDQWHGRERGSEICKFQCLFLSLFLTDGTLKLVSKPSWTQLPAATFREGE